MIRFQRLSRWPLSCFRLDSRFNDGPDPVSKFTDIFGLDVDITRSGNFCDKSFPSKNCLLETAEFGHRVLAGVTECDKVVIINDQALARSECMPVNSPLPSMINEKA